MSFRSVNSDAPQRPMISGRAILQLDSIPRLTRRFGSLRGRARPKFWTREEFFGGKMFGRRRFEMEINMRGLCPLIQVFDMDNSLRFYCELLGFEIVEKTA